MTKFQVGQQLYFVPEYSNSRPYFLVIEKVGRQYLTLSNRSRADKYTLRTKEILGRVYLSEDEYKQQVALSRAYSMLAHQVTGRPQPGVTLADIAEVRRLLRLPDPFGQKKSEAADG